MIDANERMAAIEGHATVEGTQRFAHRFEGAVAEDFFTRSQQGLTLSSIGVGMYKGEVSAEGDEEWVRSLKLLFSNGVNVADTAIRYRSMQSERTLGRALREQFQTGAARRDEFFISTKGGLVAVPCGTAPAEHVQRELVEKRGVPADRITNDMHCIEPGFIKQELETSRANLGLKTLDCYFLHNPELAFLTFGKEATYRKLRAVFELLETAADNGKIRAYGVASWCGFRRRPDALFSIDMEYLLQIAREVGGDAHRFRYVELPLSIGMPHCRTAQGGAMWRALQDAGLDVLTSASMYEGHLPALFNLQRLMAMAGREDSPEEGKPAAVSFPVSENSLIQLFATLIASRESGLALKDETLRLSKGRLDIYPAALNVVRSTPGVTCALAGLRLERYARETLPLTREEKTAPEAVTAFWAKLAARPGANDL